MEDVFVSYTRKCKAQVAPIVRNLEKQGLKVYWDDDLGPGEWENQLLYKLRQSQIFVVIITEDVLNRDDVGAGQSYVHREITEAIEADIKMIVPIVVGELNFEKGLDRLSRFHGLTVDRLEQVIAHEKWLDFVQGFKAYLEAGGRNSLPATQPTGDAEAFGWPVRGDHLVERQALALAIIMLEGELPFLVTDAARSLQSRIEGQSRDMTEEEKNSRPRALTAPAQSEILHGIGARRQRVLAGHLAGSEVIRFHRYDHRARLLEYLWMEQPEVRALLIGWIQDLFESNVNRQLALHLGRGLTHLARIDLQGLRYEMLGRLLTPPVYSYELSVLSELLAAAYDVKANRPHVRAILKAIYRGEGFDEGRLVGAGRAMAMEVALGALAERTAEPAIELLKMADRHLRASTPAGARLRAAVLVSPMLYGTKANRENSDAVQIVETQGTVAGASDDDDAAGVRNEDPEIANVLDCVAEAEAPGIVGGAPDDDVQDTPPRASDGQPAALFLKALADWLDVQISEPKQLVRRQVPLWVFLSAFERMPLYARSAPRRLTLEELVFEIGVREAGLLDRMVAAFARAALANKQTGSDYVAFQHVNKVSCMFARERHKSEHRMTTVQDPYLVFMRKCYGRVADAGKGREGYFLRGCGPYMTPDDISFIKHDLTN